MVLLACWLSWRTEGSVPGYEDLHCVSLPTRRRSRKALHNKVQELMGLNMIRRRACIGAVREVLAALL